MKLLGTIPLMIQSIRIPAQKRKQNSFLVEALPTNNDLVLKLSGQNSGQNWLHSQLLSDETSWHNTFNDPINKDPRTEKEAKLLSGGILQLLL
ncbi:hypothetical protein L6452_41393 [Arctium lappa]|uniref:Uncharacterized protein n=1 Tax=Arctium lappa TaxID=4217 RepID=A0ACB8XPC5_ARCLA|nr:hypothetical protein L6452_41393 [Arctium lappa]